MVGLTEDHIGGHTLRPDSYRSSLIGGKLSVGVRTHVRGWGPARSWIGEPKIRREKFLVLLEQETLCRSSLA